MFPKYWNAKFQLGRVGQQTHITAVREQSVCLVNPSRGVCFILKDSRDTLFLDIRFLSQPYYLEYFINVKTCELLL